MIDNDDCQAGGPAMTMKEVMRMCRRSSGLHQRWEFEVRAFELVGLTLGTRRQRKAAEKASRDGVRMRGRGLAAKRRWWLAVTTAYQQYASAELERFMTEDSGVDFDDELAYLRGTGPDPFEKKKAQ